MPPVGYTRLIQKCMRQQPKLCYDYKLHGVHLSLQRYHQQSVTSVTGNLSDSHQQIEQQDDNVLHTPVFIKEIVDLINPQRGQVCTDSTVYCLLSVGCLQIMCIANL